MLSKFQEIFELERTFLSICCCLVAKKVRENRKKKFIWIFNIIANVDVLMWNFSIPRMKIRESEKGIQESVQIFTLMAFL